MRNAFCVLFATLMLASGSLSAQSLRSVVALVKPKLSEEARAGFNKIADSFSTQGYTDLEAYFRGLAEGGHGSGVLVKAPSGQVILVTNRHVASYCETAEVSFRNADGTTTVWPDCPVVYTDPQVDIALIQVPQEPRPKSLDFAVSVPEGAEVWSAGFPGLGGRPEWQLAKGTITNSSVTVTELGAERDAVFYQHSASIDPGNSGGPLLVGDPAKPESFRVVGINSYSVRNRNNTFFSVPTTKVQEALKRYTELGQTQINDEANALVRFLNASEWDKFGFRRFISYHWATASGWDDFVKASRTMTTKDRSLWYDRFFSSPLDALSQFLSYQMWKKVQGASDEIVYVDTDKKVPESPVASLTIGKDKVSVNWTQESGRWKVSKVQWASEVVAEKKPEAAPAAGLAIPTGTSLVVTGLLPVNNPWSSSLGFGVAVRTDSRFTGPLAFNGHFGFLQEASGKNDYAKNPPAAVYNFLGAGMGLGYFYTVKFPKGGYIAPFAAVDVDLELAFPLFQGAFLSSASNPDSSVLSTFLLAGALAPRVGLEWSPDDYWAIGAEVGARWYAFGLSGLKSVPVSVYVKAAALQ